MNVYTAQTPSIKAAIREALLDGDTAAVTEIATDYVGTDVTEAARSDIAEAIAEWISGDYDLGWTVSAIFRSLDSRR
jgi:hypothetical protein